MDNQFLEQQLQFHVLHSQHKYIQSNATIGDESSVVNTLTNVFLISLFGVLSQYLIRLLSSVPRFVSLHSPFESRALSWCRCTGHGKITLQAKEIKGGSSNRSLWSFSDLTKAILWYCNLHMEEMGINQLVETTDDTTADYWLEDDPNAKQHIKSYKPPTFRIDQRNKFLLKDNIYVQFCFSQEEDEITSDGKRQTMSYKVCRIEITSTCHSATEINKVLKEIHKAHLHYINTNTLNGQYIFTYKGNNTFEQTPFVTNKTWKSYFMEDKESLKQNIRQMKRFDDPNHINKLAGLPDHLVILAEGPPGTGKNSLFKVLMKEEFSDRQLVIIPSSSVKSAQEIVDIVRSEYLNGIFCPCNKRVYQFDEIDKSFPEVCKTQPAYMAETAKKTYKELKQPNPPTFEEYMQNMIVEEEQKRDLVRQVWLNMLDGAIENPQMVMFMTLNHYHKLDEAFKRPGRIHIRVSMPYASNKIVKEIFGHIFSYDFKDHEINERLDQIEDFAYSQSKVIQSCCRAVTDFSIMKNNTEYITCALDTLTKTE